MEKITVDGKDYDLEDKDVALTKSILLLTDVLKRISEELKR